MVIGIIAISNRLCRIYCIYSVYLDVWRCLFDIVFKSALGCFRKGVDYAECEVPMQLSAEIDRYNWTPGVKLGYANAFLAFLELELWMTTEK